MVRPAVLADGVGGNGNTCWDNELTFSDHRTCPCRVPHVRAPMRCHTVTRDSLRPHHPGWVKYDPSSCIGGKAAGTVVTTVFAPSTSGHATVRAVMPRVVGAQRGHPPQHGAHWGHSSLVLVRVSALNREPSGFIL